MAGNRPSNYGNAIVPAYTSIDNPHQRIYKLLRSDRPSEIQDFLRSHPNLDLNLSVPNTARTFGCDLLLHHTIVQNKLEVTELLLEKGADVDHPCCKGRNAIHCAAYYGRADADVLACLTRDMEEDRARDYINSRDKEEGWTALHYQSVPTGTIRPLLARGANPAIIDNNGDSAFDLALKMGHWFLACELGSRLWDMEVGKGHLADYFFPTRKLWVEIFRRNTTFIMSLILKRSLQGYEYCTCHRVLECIRLDFERMRKPEDPVGKGGRESVCFSKKLDNLVFTAISVPLFSSETVGYINGRKAKYLNYMREPKGCHNSNYNQIGIQCALTLDEYCLSSLDESALEKRNNDQVLSRYQDEVSPNPSPDQRRILTVPKISIYTIEHLSDNRIDMYTVMEKPARDIFGTADFEDICNFFDEAPLAISLEWLLIGALISRCVDSLNSSLHPNLSTKVLNIFEWSIFKLSAKVQDYINQEAPNNEENNNGKNFVLQIGDIREELSLIRSVLAEQEQVWRQFIQAKFSEFWDTDKDCFVVREKYMKIKDIPRFTEAMDILKKPQTRFAEYKRRIAVLDENAERVQSSIALLLDLKSKENSLREIQTTTSMSAAVIGFSLVTIVFTPLSFLSSLFALPINHLQSHQSVSTLDNGTPFYSSSYVAGWMLTTGVVSLTLTFFLTWVVLKLVTDFRSRNAMKSVWSRVQKQLSSAEGASPKATDPQV